MKKYNEWFELREIANNGHWYYGDTDSQAQTPDQDQQADAPISKANVRWYLTQLERKLGQKVQKYMPLINVVNSRGMLNLLYDLVNDAGQLRPTFVQNTQNKLDNRF